MISIRYLSSPSPNVTWPLTDIWEFWTCKCVAKSFKLLLYTSREMSSKYSIFFLSGFDWQKVWQYLLKRNLRFSILIKNTKVYTYSLSIFSPGNISIFSWITTWGHVINTHTLPSAQMMIMPHTPALGSPPSVAFPLRHATSRLWLFCLETACETFAPCSDW